MTESKGQQQSFDCLFVHIEPNEMIALHEQDTWELSCVLFGSGTRIVGEERAAFRSGDLVLVPPRMPHCWYFEPDVKDRHNRISCISIMMPQQLLDGIKTLLPEMSDTIEGLTSNPVARVYAPAIAKPIIKMMRQMEKQLPGERAATLLALLCKLGEAARQYHEISYARHSPTARRKMQAETYIACSLQRGLTLDALAHHLGMNRSSLCIFFRREFGMTFSQYVNQCRITEACRLLTETSLPIQAICFRTGYSNISYFNRTFKASLHCSPKDYRRKQSVSPIEEDGQK